jgi:hypothetical protein
MQAEPTEQEDSCAVRRRCVLYVSGFDPKGASHYHALLGTEGQQQSQRDGWSLSVGPRKRQANGNWAWPLQSSVDGQAVHTHYEFLGWDDIVRAHWTRSIPKLWWQTVTTTVFNLRCGALWHMYTLSWPPVVALTLPFLLVLLLMLGTPVAGLCAAWLAQALGGVWWLAALAGLAAAGTVWSLGRQLEARYSMYWMVRSYAFNALQAQGKTPELEQRLQSHARTVVNKVLQGGYDEVLLVGHSSGASMAASMLGKALAVNPEIARQKTKLSFLTLGQWLPALGTLPVARSFRRELQAIAKAKGLSWIDFSAPPDGCCFALQDPLAACGVAHSPEGVSLKVLNPKFADMFAPDVYHKAKKDKLNLHFQYLKASHKPVDCDYFLTVAGPKSLASRYKQLPSVQGYAGLRGWPRDPGSPVV